MKKIINGKKYDTETAECIAEKSWFDNSVSYRQKETYYKKKTGEFFRHDEKRTTWGNIEDYEQILPIAVEEAKQRLEVLLSVQDYEELFGIIEE